MALIKVVRNGCFFFTVQIKPMTKGGVYAVRIPQYKDRYPQNKILKIGHSTNIEHRFSSHDTFALPEDSLLHHIETVVHSPTNAVSGTHILESLIHHYYRQHRMSQDREFFKFDLPFSIGPELITYLGTKNIQDVSLYSSLADVPKTILDPSYVENQNDMAATVMTDLYIPRLCQLPILKALLNHFQTYDKGGLYLPPGIGKTYLVGFMLNRMLNLSRILILTPQIMIGDEFRKMLGHLGTGNRQLICVSSEDRNIEDLQPTLATLPRYVLISTYQTYCQKATFFESQYDLIVFDEAHHLATSPTYQSALQLRGKKLFLTATPKIIHSDLETDEVVTYSLDNEEVYGPPIYSLTLIDAIQQGILCDYRFLIYQEEVVPTVMMETEQDSEDGDDNDDNGSESGSDDSSEDILGSVQSDAMVRDPTVCEPHIRMLVDLYGRKRILVFYNNCSDASGASQRLAQMMPHIQSFYVDGSLSKTQRQSIFEKFEQDDPTPKVLFNVNIVSEGVSLPCVDCILLMATKTSSIALIQLIGRALRLYNGKTEAIVCIPSRCSSTIDVCLESVYVDAEKSRTKSRTAIESRILVESVNTENIQRFIKVKVTAIEVSRTGGLWEYKWKLCQEWESLNPNQSIPQKTSQIGSWINTQKASWKKTQILEHPDSTLEEKSKAKKIRIGTLSPERQTQLNGLFTWRQWMKGEDPWETTFQLCQHWESLNPNQSIPSRTSQIGKWIDTQKQSWKRTQIMENPQSTGEEKAKALKRKKTLLSPERQTRLNDLFTWRQWMHEDPWETTFQLCQHWESLNPNQSIPQKTSQIGTWINNNKKAWKRTQIMEHPDSTLEEKSKAKKIRGTCTLSPERQTQLNGLFTWRQWMKGEDPWETTFQLCQQWESLNPNQSIPQKTSQIGSWIDTQKASWKNGSKSVINNIVNGEKKKTLRILSDQEQQQLKQLHTWNMWMNANDPWETAFKLCLEWERINKDQTIKLSTVYQEKNIGTWFNNQKTAWNKGPHPLVDQMPCGKKKKVQRALSDHQRNSMEQLYSFKQWMHAWKLTFESCKEWERINTDQMIKSSTVFQEKNIGAWFNTQRTALKKTQILENPQSTTEEKTQAKKCEVRVLSAIMQFQLEELLTWRARLTGGDSWKLTLYLCKEWERINTDQTIKSSTVHREKNIGGWISEQKKAWSLSQKLSNPALSEQDKEKLLKHRSVVMSTERQSDINELHTWRTWLNDDDSWNVNFQVCKEWERINTDQTIKSSTVYRERNIGTWFARQKKIWIGFMELFNPDLTEDRKIYIEKNMNGLMNDERGSKLDELLTWRTWLNAEDPWTSTFRLCQEWERLNSDKVIATSIVYMDVRIGGWINHQKDAFKAFQMISSPNSTEEEKSKDQKMRIGILSPERQTQLNGLFTWRQWMNEDPWETTFQLCQQWESLNPNQSIPQRTSQIGRWINTQKASWKKTQILEHPDSTLEEKSKAQKIKGTLLSPERQTRLNELFTWRQWMKGEDPWNTTFQLCQQWELLNPNQSIPSKTSKIGTWIDNQKTSWKKTQILEHPDSTLEEKSKAQKVSNALLSPKRQTRLNDLFTWRQWMTQKSVENTSTAVKRSGDDSTNKSPKRIKLDE